MECCLVGLQASTSSDVYFLTDVFGGNAAFGLVRSVLRWATHPEPLTIVLSVVHAAGALTTLIDANRE